MERFKATLVLLLLVLSTTLAALKLILIELHDFWSFMQRLWQ